MPYITPTARPPTENLRHLPDASTTNHEDAPDDLSRSRRKTEVGGGEKGNRTADVTNTFSFNRSDEPRERRSLGNVFQLPTINPKLRHFRYFFLSFQRSSPSFSSRSRRFQGTLFCHITCSLTRLFLSQCQGPGELSTFQPVSALLRGPHPIFPKNRRLCIINRIQRTSCSSPSLMWIRDKRENVC